MLRDKFIGSGNELPKIQSIEKKVISEETAYQMTSILQGTVERGTACIENFKSSISRKTGTTNDNYDAWFIGFSSNLIIGVYIGYDNPKTLGKMKQVLKQLQYSNILLKIHFLEVILTILTFLKIYI